MTDQYINQGQTLPYQHHGGQSEEQRVTHMTDHHNNRNGGGGAAASHYESPGIAYDNNQRKVSAPQGTVISSGQPNGNAMSQNFQHKSGNTKQPGSNASTKSAAETYMRQANHNQQPAKELSIGVGGEFQHRRQISGVTQDELGGMPSLIQHEIDDDQQQMNRRTPKLRGHKNRLKGTRTSHHKKQRKFKKNGGGSPTLETAENFDLNDEPALRDQHPSGDADSAEGNDQQLDRFRASQTEKRQRLSQESSLQTVVDDAVPVENQGVLLTQDRDWSMASVASSQNLVQEENWEDQELPQGATSPPLNALGKKSRKLPEMITSGEAKQEQSEENKDSTTSAAEEQMPTLNKERLASFNQQSSAVKQGVIDPVSFSKNKVEKFIVRNPLNQRFITKEKARLPYSVFKPHAHHVTFLKSIFEGRPPVAFFQYPSYVGVRRVADRIRMYSREEVEHLFMSFRISDSTHIYNAVVNSCKYAGFTMIESNNSNLFNVQWTGYINANDIKNLNKYQKTNHFPGSSQLGRKDLLWRNISRMRSKFPKDFAIAPISYLVQEEHEAFMAERERDTKALWILKPVAASCGRGIKIVDSFQKVNKREGYLASKYVANPHLINGLKYDLRVYVLVTSFNPLRIYMYNDGLVRFATEKYSTDPRKLQKKFMHLTNFSINKKNTNFVKNTDKQGLMNLKNKVGGNSTLEDEDQQEFDQNTSKWDFKMLQAAYEKHNINYEYVIAQFKDLVVKTLLCVEPHITQNLQKNPTSRNNCFELYGFDILVDSNYKPWVLEVNVLPSLSSSSPFDKRIKTMLICDTLTLVGIRGYDKQKFHSQTTELLGLAPFAQSLTLSELRQKPRLTGNEQLTKDELEMLMDLDEEFMRRGNFQRIFPLASNANFYEQFFETKRYQNALCAAFLTSPQHIRDQLLSKHRRVYTSQV